MGANNWLSFAYLWGHYLQTVLHSAETENIEIIDVNKIKRQTNLDRHGPQTYATFFLIADSL
jgi:hypothetical protein